MKESHQQSHKIQIQSKVDQLDQSQPLQKSVSDMQQIFSDQNAQNESVVHLTNMNQSLQNNENQKNSKDLNIFFYDYKYNLYFYNQQIYIKDNSDKLDEDEEEVKYIEEVLLKYSPLNLNLIKFQRKPGNVEKGYILYSETLIDKLIKDKKLTRHLLKQFKIDRQPVWSFEKEQMKSPTEVEDIRVLCITWNMHGNMPQLCTKQLLNSDEIQHHVIVVSSQECQRSIPMSFFCENKEKWEAHLCSQLGNQYTLVQSISMNALHLVIFLHQSILKYVTAISSDYKATGIANLIGNKGGIGISIDIGEKSFLFINSHFASGQDNNPQRNEDYRKISQSLNLPKYYSNPNESLFKRFHYIFWMGDFNYRIGASSKKEVDEMIQQNKFFELLKKDQLLAQRKNGEVFSEFQEGLILFPPSYKMLDSENKYSEGIEARIPGWTDRIFFKQKNPNSITLLNYEMALNVFGSDHRPVFAQFLVKVKINEKFQPINIKQSNGLCNIF